MARQYGFWLPQPPTEKSLRILGFGHLHVAKAAAQPRKSGNPLVCIWFRKLLYVGAQFNLDFVRPLSVLCNQRNEITATHFRAARLAFAHGPKPKGTDVRELVAIGWKADRLLATFDDVRTVGYWSPEGKTPCQQ